jgi:hypothetical protein
MSLRLRPSTHPSACADAPNVAALGRGCPAARAFARERPTATLEDITYG